MSESIEFRPLAIADMPRLVAWFNAPHAVRWYGARMARQQTLEEIDEEYRASIEGTVPIRPYLVVCDGRPVGMCEWVLLGDYPATQKAYGVDDPNAANCDIIIGEPDAVYRGLGVRVVRAFLERIIFADRRVTSCVIDPETDNFIAIRAYEKAGFQFVRAAADDLEGNSVYLMELGRRDFDKPVETPPFVIRPMRESEIATAFEIDDDAARAFAERGLPMDFADDHPFVTDEHTRWQEAARDGLALFACAPDGERIAFAALGSLGGAPYLHQLSVRCAWKRRGVGSALLTRAQRWSVRAGELWLTTYDHVPWNAPFYERHGFVRVQDDACNDAIRALLVRDRNVMPDGAHQVAMVYRHR